MPAIGHYKNKIKKGNIAAIRGKRAHEDPNLIADIQLSMSKIISPYIVNMDMAEAIRWYIGWDDYVKDKSGITGVWKYESAHLDRGQIVNVNLWGHMDPELTFPHPAMVIDSGGNWALVIPISSPAYGDSDPYHYDLVPDDGVIAKCALKLDMIKAVSKRRIIGILGRISNSSKLDEIDDLLIKHFCPVTHASYEAIKEQNKSLSDQLSTKNEEILLKNEEILRLTHQIDRLSSLVGVNS